MRSTSDARLRVTLVRLTALLMFVLSGTPPTCAQESAKTSGQVRQLRQERVSVLQELYETKLVLHRDGATGMAEVMRAKAAYLEAKLELCDTPQMRLQILRELVAAAEQSLENATNLWKNGAVNKTDMLSAKVQLLEAKIALQQELAAE